MESLSYRSVVEGLVRCAVAEADDEVTPEERQLQAQVAELTAQLQARRAQGLPDAACLRLLTRRPRLPHWTCSDFSVDTDPATLALAARLIGGLAQVKTVSLYRDADRIDAFRRVLQAHREKEWQAGRKALPPLIVWDNRVLCDDMRELVTSPRALALQRDLTPPGHDAASGGYLAAVAHLVIGASAEAPSLFVGEGDPGRLPLGFITYKKKLQTADDFAACA